MNDPVIDEVRRIRDAHAARFDYDLDAIYNDIKDRERKSGLIFVRGVARRDAPDAAAQPSVAAISVPPEAHRL